MKADLDALTPEIISAAITVHREIGPGALESTYEMRLGFELGDRHLLVERQETGTGPDFVSHSFATERRITLELSRKWFVDGGIKRVVRDFQE